MTNSRRDFIKKSAFAFGALTILPSHVVFSKGKNIAPSDKVNVAFCGIGNRGGQILNTFMNTGWVNNVAMCDTDMGGAHTLKNMAAYPEAAQYQDFRKMFDEMGDKIDAVCVGTPDFSHFPITILAMSMGINVYVEKPLTRTFQESELLLGAAKKYKVVTQMGNQGHSEANYFQFKAWVEAGIIKDVTKVVAHMNSPRRWHGWDTSMTALPKVQEVPDTLDWDTWLGGSEFHDYNKDYINGQWRCWYDFGMGALGDWGAHIMDTAHEFLNLGLPYEIDPVRIEGHNPLFYPQTSSIDFKFPKRKKMPPLTIAWRDGVNNVPELPEGYGEASANANVPTTNMGKVKKAKLRPGKIIYSKDLTFKGGSHGSELSIIPADIAQEMASQLPHVPKSPSDHFQNFIKACRGEEETRSPFEVSAPLSQVFVLGTLAQRLNTKLEFDRKTKQITNNTLANQLLVGPPPRKGWEEFYKL
jgi:hypothetical protein